MNDARETADVADDGSFAFARARAFESSNRVAIVWMNRVFAGKRDSRVMTRQCVPPLPARTSRHPRVVVASRPSTPKTSTLDRSGRDDDDDDDARVSTVSTDRRRTGGTDGPTDRDGPNGEIRRERRGRERRRESEDGKRRRTVKSDAREVFASRDGV